MNNQSLPFGKAPETPFGVIKIHFKSALRAVMLSTNNRCYSGERTSGGKVKTWIAYIPKAHARESTKELIARINKENE